ncbi:MAG TPA: AarF/UbiB family protein [Friedmanniella sp.]
MSDVGGVLIHQRRRVTEIVDVFARYGFVWLASAFGAATGDEPSRFPFQRAGLHLAGLADPALVAMTTGERLRAALAELGTTWVKLGQMLSLRADLVGADVADALGGLQSSVPADAAGLATALVEAELGQRVDVVFARFSDEPLASGSVAQVHAATLHDGTEVVVKVLHHDADRKVRSDLELMKVLARSVEALNPNLARYNPVAVVGEFSDLMSAAVDFTHELTHLQQIGANLRVEPDIVVPQAYPELSTPRVLTMTRLYGGTVDSRQSLEASGWTVERFVQRTSDVFLAMIFRDGMFHADPHPGNFIVPDGGHLAILDFGDVGYLTASRRLDFQSLLLAISERDAGDFTHALMAVTRASVEVDEDVVQADVEEWMQRWLGGGVGEQDLGPALEHLLELIREDHLTFPSDLLMPLRVLLRLQGLGLQLGSTVPLDDMLRPYLTQMLADRYKPAALLKQARRTLRSWERLLGPLPDELAGLAVRLRREGAQVDIKMHDPDEVIDKLIDGLLASASIIGASSLLSRRTPPTVADMSVPGVAVAALAAVTWRRLQVRRSSHKKLSTRVAGFVARRF